MTKKKFFESYKEIPSYNFTINNSCRYNVIPPPDIYWIEDGYDKKHKIIGYTYDPPFDAAEGYFAILFEDQTTFETLWSHYSLNMFEDEAEDVIKLDNINIRNVRR